MYDSNSPIGAGDRAPDFSLRRADGQMINLYTGLSGHMPVVLFYPDAASLADEAPALRDAAAEDGIADIFAVVRAAPEALSAAADTAGGAIQIMSDPDGKTARAYGFAADAGPMALRFDNNLRLTALRAEGAAALAHYVARAREREAPPVQHVTSGAPVLIVPYLIPPDLCRELVDLHHTAGSYRSTVTYNKDGLDVREVFEDHKNRFDHDIGDRDMRVRLSEIFARRLNVEIWKAFNYRVTGHEGFSVVRYEGGEGGHFGLHRDNTSPTTTHLRFAVTINLNFGEYEGGWLRFPEFGPDLYAPETGGAIIFSCSHLHEATPVTSGTRYALLTFLFGADAPHRT